MSDRLQIGKLKGFECKDAIDCGTKSYALLFLTVAPGREINTNIFLLNMHSDSSW